MSSFLQALVCAVLVAGGVYTLEGEIQEATQPQNLVWIQDRPVVEELGPDDAIFCRMEDPRGSVVFEGFGRCNIVLERAAVEHAGVWKMMVGTSGHVYTETHDVIVSVTGSKSPVSVSVWTEKPAVLVSCSLPVGYQVRACKFRDPSGRVMIANNEIGHDGYEFNGVGVSVESNVNSNECGLRIVNPVTSDLGLWRCAMDTDDDTYFGFLTVLCPFAMMDPNVAAVVVTEPTLTTVSQVINAPEGESITMSCSVQSAIRYCYFRALNGSVFNVGPGPSVSSPEYVGAGFDAGECGIRFSSLNVRDSGTWSCHVGFPDASLPEQRARINVTIGEAMVVNQYEYGGHLIVEGTVHGNQPVEYCRYVRIDGTGFTWRNLPNGYVSTDVTYSDGRCSLRVNNPTILDHHAWTVVARIRGQDKEVAGYTSHTITTSTPDSSGGFSYVWLLLILVCVSFFFVVLLSCGKNNREWAKGRASAFRDSLRNSLRKKPLDDGPKNNAMAA